MTTKLARDWVTRAEVTSRTAGKLDDAEWDDALLLCALDAAVCALVPKPGIQALALAQLVRVLPLIAEAIVDAARDAPR